MSGIAVPARHPALASASVILATMIYSIDWTIAAVALPHMQGTFSATQDQISWVITSYIVASAVMIPTANFMSQRFGRKRVFVVAVSGFIAASAWCGLANSLQAEVVARIIQGACGAFLVPLSQAAVLDTYPPEKHARMMGFYSRQDRDFIQQFRKVDGFRAGLAFLDQVPQGFDDSTGARGFGRNV